MTYKTSKSISDVLAYILVLLLIVGVIGIVSFFTGGFTSDFKTFYVVIDGKDVLSDTNGYVLTEEKETIIDVKYVFGKFNNEQHGYTFSISANTAADKDFVFTVDGKTHRFSEETDLTKGFIVEQSETSFTIKPKGNVEKILTERYGGKDVVVGSAAKRSDLFVLTVYSYNCESQISVYFTVPYTASGITLDKEEIVF